MNIEIKHPKRHTKHPKNKSAKHSIHDIGISNIQTDTEIQVKYQGQHRKRTFQGYVKKLQLYGMMET